MVAELGPLGEADARTELLRLTLRTYFDTGQNAAATAARIRVHERTVAYRLRSIENRLGFPITERRDELSIALRLAEVLGDASDLHLALMGEDVPSETDL